MKFNELSIRELNAQATAACTKVASILPDKQKLKFENIIVDFIEPCVMEDEEDEDFEYFSVLGHVRLIDETNVSFKADLVWMGDDCDLAGPTEEVVAFLGIEVPGFTFQP
ncbi:MAG: hypothetical protein K6C10_04680 [Prevotella sp.]|nr:hypothetical protein [Prevotella sp.]